MKDAKIGILVEILQNQVNIVITNPFLQDRIKVRQGHGIALENVKQRESYQKFVAFFSEPA